MNVILDQRKNGRIQDSIEYVLNTDRKTFNKILRTLKAPNGSLDFPYQFELDIPDTTQTDFFNIRDFLKGVSNLKKDDINKETLDRIKKLQKCRTVELAKKQISKEYKLSQDEIQEIFSVLEGKKEFSEFIEKEQENSNLPKKKNIFTFLDFRKVKMLPEGKASLKNYYLGIMEKLAYGEYAYNYFIPEYRMFNNNFRLIKNRIMAEEDTLKHKIILKEKDEPDWKISDELREYVFKDMPENLNKEEISVWIYMKLCKTFNYNDASIFEENNNNINTNFLENLKPDSKVICFDFARVYAKFINTLPGNEIEAQVVGTNGHFFVELISKDMIAKAEATNQRDYTNEFFKTKMGLPIEGLKASFDEQDIIKNAIKQFTPIIYKEEQTIANYIKMLDAVHRDEEKEGIEKESEGELLNKLSSLTKTMKEHGVQGTEAIMGIMKFISLGFLGENVEKTWLRESSKNENGQEMYSSSIAVNKEEEFYIVNSKTMEVENINKEELIERFRNKQYAYKDSKNSIKVVNEALPELEEKGQKEVEK